MNQTERVIVGCSAGVVVMCFLPWFSISIGGESGMGTVASTNAFDDTVGVFAFLAAAVVAGLIAADHAGMLPWDKKIRLLAPLLAAGVGVLCMVINLGRGGGMSVPGISAGRTFWFYVAFVLMAVAAWKTFVRWQAGAAAVASAPGSDTPGE